MYHQLIWNTVNLLYNFIEINQCSCCFNHIDQLNFLVINFSPGLKVSITLLDEFKKTCPCEGIICVSAWTNTTDFVLLISIFVCLFWRSEILANLNRSKFLLSFSRLAPTLPSYFLHFYFYLSEDLQQAIHSPWSRVPLLVWDSLDKLYSWKLQIPHLMKRQFS